MLDDEIRDIMNRGSSPKLELIFEITLESEKSGHFSLGGIPQKELQHYLNIRIKNIGSVYAKYINYFVEINRFLLDENESNRLKISRRENSGAEYVEFYGENTIRDIVDYEHTAIGAMPKYGPSRFDPLLPTMVSESRKLKIKKTPSPHLHVPAFKDDQLTWRIYADNATVEIGSIRIGDLPSYKILFPFG